MKALIVDDEFMPAEFLEELIKKHCPKIIEIEVLNDPEEAILFLCNNKVDLLFLDIEMPGISGFDLLEALPKKTIPPVIFTTAYQEYAMQAFDLNAIHYLLKPIHPQKLIEAVSRVSKSDSNLTARVLSAIQAVKSDEANEVEKISLPEGQSYHLVSQEDIIQIEGAGSYSTFHLLNDRKIMVSKRMKLYEDQLDQRKFIRTHQSHIVNREYVTTYHRTDGGYLELMNGNTVPISSGLRSSVKERLGL